MNADLEQLKKTFTPKELAVITADPQVLTARFTPCGKYLVAGGYDGRIRRWDVTEAKPVELPAVDGHGGWAQAIAFHPKNPIAVSADSWGQLRAWRYDEQHPAPIWVHAAAHDGWIRDVAISPDGQFAATCGRDQVVRLWATADGAKQMELRGHQQDVYCLRFHPQGQALLSADDRGVIKQWDVANGSCVREFDARTLYTLSRLQDVGGVKVLAFDSQGKTLACGGTTPKNGGTVVGTPTILLFDFASGQLKQTLKHGTENDCFVHDVYLHDSGFLMAVTCGTPGQGKLLFQRPEDAEPFYVSTKMANTQCLSVHPDGQRVAILATSPGSNGNGRVLKDGEYKGNSSPIHILTFSAA